MRQSRANLGLTNKHRSKANEFRYIASLTFVLILIATYPPLVQSVDCSYMRISLTATPNSGKAPLTVTLGVSVQPLPGGAIPGVPLPIRFEWYFGDGSSQVLLNPPSWVVTHTYREPNSYNAVVVVTDGSSCWDKDSKAILVYTTTVVTEYLTTIQVVQTLQTIQTTIPITILASPIGELSVGALSIAALAILGRYLWVRFGMGRPVNRVCKSCGSINPAHARSFCVKCGQSLESS